MNNTVIRALVVAAAAAGIITGATVTAPMATASGPYRNCTEAHRDGRYNIPKVIPTTSPSWTGTTTASPARAKSG
jgi:hypothetical protein